MRLLKLTPILLLLFLAACSPTEQWATQGKRYEAQRAIELELEAIVAECQAELEAIHAAGSFPGATATLLLDDGRLIQLAVGNTEADGRQLTVDDRMLVGSVGKVWVAAIMHKLVEQGMVSYDDLAADWFENDSWYSRIPNSAEVTVRQLLRHQSGLERYEFKPEFWEELMLDPERTWSPTELLEFVFDDEPMFPAGQGWAYADTNYIMLGMIIERATGRRFYDLADEWVNEPNLLTDTIPSTSLILPGVVQGTVVVGRQLGVGPFTQEDGKFTFNVQFEWCGGGFASTSTDLARLAMAYLSGDFLSAETRTAMLDAVPAPPLGPGSKYGLGVIITETPIGQLQGHDGFMPGYLTTMGYFPDHGVAAAIQVNTDDGRAVGMPLPAVLVRLVEKVK